MTEDEIEAASLRAKSFVLYERLVARVSAIQAKVEGISHDDLILALIDVGKIAEEAINTIPQAGPYVLIIDCGSPAMLALHRERLGLDETLSSTVSIQ